MGLVCLNCVSFVFYDRQYSLLQSLGRPKNVSHLALYDRRLSSTKPQSFIYVFLYFFLWSSIVSFKASVAQICVLCRLNDRSSMISYKSSVAKIFGLYRINDRQWSLTNPRSPKYVFYLDSMIVNDLLQSLGRPKMFFFSMIVNDLLRSLGRQNVFFICFLWSPTKPRSPKNVCHSALYDRQ